MFNLHEWWPISNLAPQLQVRKVSAQPLPTLCGPMDCSPPGSSVHGIFQARILEWVSIAYSRGFSNQEIEPSSLLSLALAGVFFTTSTMWEAHTSTTHTLGQCTTVFAQELCSGGPEMHLSYLWQVFSRTAEWVCQIWKKDIESLCGYLFSLLDIEYSMITW